MKNTIILAILFSISVQGFSQIKTSKLIGKWEVVEAQKNGENQPIKSDAKPFFVITKSEIITNDHEDTQSYTIDGEDIVIKEGRTEQRMTVKKLKKNSMTWELASDGDTYTFKLERVVIDKNNVQLSDIVGSWEVKKVTGERGKGKLNVTGRTFIFTSDKMFNQKSEYHRDWGNPFTFENNQIKEQTLGGFIFTIKNISYNKLTLVDQFKKTYTLVRIK